MLDNYNEPFNGEEGYYGGQKVRRKSFWQRYRGFVITIGSLVMVIAILVTIIFSLLTSHTQDSHALITQTPVPTSSGSNPEAHSTAAPTPTPSPVPTPITITKNVTLILAFSTGICSPYRIIINTIDIDEAQSQTRFNLTITNQQTHSSSLGFADFSLKDLTGASFSSQGLMQFPGDMSNLAGNQSFSVTRFFSFIPQSGALYTLSVNLSVGGADDCQYQDLQMTF